MALSDENPEGCALPLAALSGREQQIALLGSWSQIGHVIYALAELAVADHLTDRALTAYELAALTETDRSALHRVLRCAGAIGIVAEQDDGRFTLTELGNGLRSDQLGGLRPMALFSGSDLVRVPYAEIVHSIRTGEPAFDRVYETSFYDHLRDNGTNGRFFEDFMAHWSRQLAHRFAGRLDLGRFQRIADIGGGDGYFLAQLLRDNPSCQGELFELAPVVSRAHGVVAEHGVADRVTMTAGNFFTDPLPTRCDAYMLKSVLHDWRDDAAARILRNIHEAMGETSGRLIVIDQVVPPMNEWDHSKILDIDMLVLFGGKERSMAEWLSLFANTGFELDNEPAERGWTVLECRRARSKDRTPQN